MIFHSALEFNICETVKMHRTIETYLNFPLLIINVHF